MVLPADEQNETIRSGLRCLVKFLNFCFDFFRFQRAALQVSGNGIRLWDKLTEVCHLQVVIESHRPLFRISEYGNPQCMVVAPLKRQCGDLAPKKVEARNSREFGPRALEEEKEIRRYAERWSYWIPGFMQSVSAKWRNANKNHGFKLRKDGVFWTKKNITGQPSLREICIPIRFFFCPRYLADDNPILGLQAKEQIYHPVNSTCQFLADLLKTLRFWDFQMFIFFVFWIQKRIFFTSRFLDEKNPKVQLHGDRGDWKCNARREALVARQPGTNTTLATWPSGKDLARKSCQKIVEKTFIG